MKKIIVYSVVILILSAGVCWSQLQTPSSVAQFLKVMTQAYYAAVIDNGTTHAPTYGTAEHPTVNWTLGNIQKITSSSTGSTTPALTFTSPSGPCCLILKITHEATATAITYTWPNTVKWAGASAPTTTNTSGAVDVVSLFYDGTYYYGTSTLDLR